MNYGKTSHSIYKMNATLDKYSYYPSCGSCYSDDVEVGIVYSFRINGASEIKFHVKCLNDGITSPNFDHLSECLEWLSKKTGLEIRFNLWTV